MQGLALMPAEMAEMLPPVLSCCQRHRRWAGLSRWSTIAIDRRGLMNLSGAVVP
jgi:hypothetical protein